MARREIDFTIDKDNRDKGKTFVITEKSAMQSARWAVKAGLLALKSGLVIPDDYTGGGIAGVGAWVSEGDGFAAFSRLEADGVQPLLDELLECVKFKLPNSQATMTLLPDDHIEEVNTVFALYTETFKLHAAFSTPENR